MRLVGDPKKPRLVTIKTGRDMTKPLMMFTERKLEGLETANLSGYIFKKDSPSCGIERVHVFNQRRMPSQSSVGLFAQAFSERFPLLPIEDEGRLCDPALRANFIERVFSYHRWQELARGPATRHAAVAFHTAHKYLLLAHSRKHYQHLGRLVARADRYAPKELIERYGAVFMETLAVKPTTRKHVNVLQHIVGHLKNQLTPSERAELNEMIEDYRRGIVPLIVPLRLVKQYVVTHGVEYILNEVYLNPHPKALMLRNHA
jgi:uncharacterized protein YbgA (DUF1722 family)